MRPRQGGEGGQKLRHRGNKNDKAGRGETWRKLWKSGENEERGVCVCVCVCVCVRERERDREMKIAAKTTKVWGS